MLCSLERVLDSSSEKILLCFRGFEIVLGHATPERASEFQRSPPAFMSGLMVAEVAMCPCTGVPAKILDECFLCFEPACNTAFTDCERGRPVSSGQCGQTGAGHFSPIGGYDPASGRGSLAVEFITTSVSSPSLVPDPDAPYGWRPTATVSRGLDQGFCGASEPCALNRSRSGSGSRSSSREWIDEPIA